MGTVDLTQYVSPYSANSTTHRRNQSGTGTQTDRSRVPVMLLFQYNTSFPRLQDVSVDSSQSPRAFLLKDDSIHWAFRLTYPSGWNETQTRDGVLDVDLTDDYLWRQALDFSIQLGTLFTEGDRPANGGIGMDRPTDGTSIPSILEDFVRSRHKDCSKSFVNWFKDHRRNAGLTKHEVRFKVVHNRSNFESALPPLSLGSHSLPADEKEYQDYLKNLEGYTFCELKGEPLPSTVSEGWIWPVNVPSQETTVDSWYSWRSMLS
ncbi:hypothetical protein V866_004830 [Kwoniella sp. B9012]